MSYMDMYRKTNNPSVTNTTSEPVGVETSARIMSLLSVGDDGGTGSVSPTKVGYGSGYCDDFVAGGAIGG